MTAIQPVENELSKMIERDFYRTTLASISQKYEAMQTFINNLGQDISSIDDFLKQLERDAEQGFDVGSSQETLLFQRSTLQIDLDFYQRMKTAYVRKIFEDLHNFTRGIVKAAVEIEANPMGQSDEEIRERKLSGVRAFDSEGEYTIADVYSLLNVTERNLFELGSDIASFSVKITDAKAKQDRGFAVGNLLVNLESQRTKLTLEFKGYVLRIHQFLEQNKRDWVQMHEQLQEAQRAASPGTGTGPGTGSTSGAAAGYPFELLLRLARSSPGLLKRRPAAARL